jgi:hypothetical protein
MPNREKAPSRSHLDSPPTQRRLLAAINIRRDEVAAARREASLRRASIAKLATARAVTESCGKRISVIAPPRQQQQRWPKPWLRWGEAERVS